MTNLIKNSFFKDSFLNIVASLILTFTSQLIVYPYLAKQLSELQYGQILTTMGLINTLGVSLGSSLNNTRLILQAEYDYKKIIGDFNSIFILLSLIGVFSVGLIDSLLINSNIIQLFLYMILVVLTIFKSYFSVEFRLNINYQAILMMNIVGSVGYLIGLYVYSFTDNWVLIFILGELASTVFIVRITSLIKESYKKTDLFRKTFGKTLYLLSSALISNSMTYMDRFIIFPILGAEQVSIYSVASFLGKSLGVIMIPISGVLLTYIVKEDGLTRRKFSKRLILYIILSVVVYVGTIIFGPFVTGFLYPTIIDRAMEYMHVANLAAILQVLGMLIQPILMRYAHSRWILISQVMYLIVYLILAYFGMLYYGLMGFCVAVLLANIFRVTQLALIIYRSLKSDIIM